MVSSMGKSQLIVKFICHTILWLVPMEGGVPYHIRLMNFPQKFNPRIPQPFTIMGRLLTPLTRK